MKERQLVVNGTPTNIIEIGEGQPVVFLHGWGSQAESFHTVALRLSHTIGCRAILIDLPGFGKSAPPPEAWSVGDYAVFVKAVLDKLAVSTPKALVGHSLGGRIIIKGVATEVLSAEKLVLIAAAGMAPRRTVRKTLFTIIAKVGRALCSIPPLSFIAAPLRHRLYKIAGSDDYLNSRGMKHTFKLVVEENLKKYAKVIVMPTIILWGEKDTTTPLAEGELLSSLIHDSELVTLPNAGHYVHKDAEPVVVEHIAQFLS